MGKVYDNPEGGHGFIVVSDPDPRVDNPPGPDEGEVLSVDFEHAYFNGRNHWRRCQMCPRTFEWSTEHIMAFVYRKGPDDAHGNCVKAYFCSRTCLGEWATSNGR